MLRKQPEQFGKIPSGVSDMKPRLKGAPTPQVAKVVILLNVIALRAMFGNS